MSHTHFHLDPDEIVPKRAYSYHSDNHGGFLASALNYATVGSSSLFTTANDLAKWLANFRAAKVGGTAGVARMLEPGALNSGAKLNYALGLQLGNYRGVQTIDHCGSDVSVR